MKGDRRVDVHTRDVEGRRAAAPGPTEGLAAIVAFQRKRTRQLTQIALDGAEVEREDVVQVGRDLLGKVLATHIDGISRARSSRRRKPMRVSPIGRVMPSADDV